MYKAKYAVEAIRRSAEKKSSSLTVSLPKELTAEQRKIEVKHVADFIKDNSSITFLDFSRTNPPNKGYSTLSNDEADILCKGLAKNKSVSVVWMQDRNNPEIADKRMKSMYESLKWGMKREASNDFRGDPKYRRKSNSTYNIGRMEKFEQFFRVEEKLKRYTGPNEELNNNKRDAISDISKTVLGGRLARSVLSDDSISQGEKGNLERIGDYRYDPRGNLTNNLEYTTVATLFDGMPGSAVKAVSDHWHLAANQAKMLKEKDFSGATWLPLFGQKEIDVPPQIVGQEGWKLVSLTSAQELKQEGKDLDHCVGGYTGRCMDGQSHIVSVRNAQGEPVSTMEFQLDHGRGSAAIEQNYGKKNTEPPKEARDIEKALNAKLRGPSQDDSETSTSRWGRRKARNFPPATQVTGNDQWDNLSIDYEQIQQSVNERKDLELSVEGRVKGKLGFDVQDDEKFNKVLSVYGKVVAPTGTSIKDANGVEIPNFGPEVRNELRKRFNRLKKDVFSISPQSIGGKSEFGAQEKEKTVVKKTKKEKANHSEGYVLKSIQRSVNDIFGQYEPGSVAVSLDKSDGSTFGKVMLSIPQGADVNEMRENLESVFEEQEQVNIVPAKSKDEDALEISGISPLPVSRIMKNYASKNTAMAIGG